MWALSGLAAAALGRLISVGKDQRWPTEVLIAIGTALILGVVATMLDFGGWNELDWRAGIFAGFGALAAIGLLRLWRVMR
jgi:hypothetical protein